MSDSVRAKNRLQAVGGYVDQVARKERFLGAHPDVVIEHDKDVLPYEQWRGRVPGHEQVTSAELGGLLDWLEEIIAVDEAEQRWPGWRFTRIGSQWKAEGKADSRVVFGPTLGAAEARVGVEVRKAGKADVLSGLDDDRLTSFEVTGWYVPSTGFEAGVLTAAEE